MRLLEIPPALVKIKLPSPLFEELHGLIACLLVLWKMQACVCVKVAACVCKHIMCVGDSVDGPGIGPVLGL